MKLIIALVLAMGVPSGHLGGTTASLGDNYPTDTQCKTSAKADIVLLIDGSWSIGRLNFKTIRIFIARLVSTFDIGPDDVQIGLVEYSGEPTTEWHLNAHPTKASLLKAVANLPYKGGNTMTGVALNYILQYNFRHYAGMRQDSRKMVILLTDGKSQDEVVSHSQNLKETGIELYAIGVKNADENELRSIASDPLETHMYNVDDFQLLLDIVDDLTLNLWNSIKGSGVDGSVTEEWLLCKSSLCNGAPCQPGASALLLLAAILTLLVEALQ
ncbi:collagen alpha-1(XII) chain-like [Nerophis ophidion]|uniref:collagen alpha-1(XII) chain-like n=1 Tax=Nerophis ophidion TaxID=159077 RepID=UPI002AE087E9|nr:collagen alpha-1(XII) chain-like [Nerophis ophidion]